MKGFDTRRSAQYGRKDRSLTACSHNLDSRWARARILSDTVSDNEGLGDLLNHSNVNGHVRPK